MLDLSSGFVPNNGWAKASVADLFGCNNKALIKLIAVTEYCVIKVYNDDIRNS